MHNWHADWLTVHEALGRILSAVEPLSAERVPLDLALGRTLAETVTATATLPPWDNSAMDGYAVRSQDVVGASPASPAALEVVEEIAAGSRPLRSIGPGQAAKVMTGAPVPPGADSVIRVEHTAEWQRGEASASRADWGVFTPKRVHVVRDVDAGRNVRPRGGDMRPGDTLLEPGRVLRAAEIGLLAMAGAAEPLVHRRPRVAIVSNGDELVGLEDYERVRAGERIVDSNSYMLAAAAVSAGAEPRRLGIARDDESSLREHLSAVGDADILLTTAGASVGQHDLMKDVLASLGFRLGFWRVRMQPGSPFSFGWLGQTAVFGLPGNPASALVTFEVFVRPAIRRMLGRPAVYNRTIQVELAEAIPPGPDRMRFLRARLEPAGGRWLASLSGPQGSGLVTPFAAADALLVVPVRESGFAPGETITAIPLPGTDPGQQELGY